MRLTKKFNIKSNKIFFKMILSFLHEWVIQNKTILKNLLIKHFWRNIVFSFIIFQKYIKSSCITLLGKSKIYIKIWIRTATDVSSKWVSYFFMNECCKMKCYPGKVFKNQFQQIISFSLITSIIYISIKPIEQRT